MFVDYKGIEFIDCNDALEEAIEVAHIYPEWEKVKAVLEELRNLAREDRKVLFPIAEQTGDDTYNFLTVPYCGKDYQVIFTSEHEYSLGEPVNVIATSLSSVICQIDDPYEGLIINPYGRQFIMDRKLIDVFKAGCGWE